MGPSCMVTFDCSGLIWKRLKSLSIVLQDPSHNFEPQVIVELVIHLPLVYSGISLSLYIYVYIHVLQILQILQMLQMLQILQIYHIYTYIHCITFQEPFHSIPLHPQMKEIVDRSKSPSRGKSWGMTPEDTPMDPEELKQAVTQW